MNSFDQARREILAALFMEYHRTTNDIAGFDDLKGRYSFKVARLDWFDPIISEIEHLLIVARTYEDVAARIKPHGYGEFLRELLQQLDATNIEISWQKEEILSDAADYGWFPTPNGWKWFQYNREADKVVTGAPASDRIVPLDHNQSEHRAIADGLVEIRDAIRGANDLNSEERDRLTASLGAAESLWQATQLKVIQIKVGIILTLEDAVKALGDTAKAVAAALLVDTIKAFIKTRTGIDLDAL